LYINHKLHFKTKLTFKVTNLLFFLFYLNYGHKFLKLIFAQSIKFGSRTTLCMVIHNLWLLILILLLLLLVRGLPSWSISVKLILLLSNRKLNSCLLTVTLWLWLVVLILRRHLLLHLLHVLLRWILSHRRHHG